MLSEAPSINWEDILDRFSSYKGNIKTFCTENNITAHQLYYRRRMSRNSTDPVFHAVSFKTKNTVEDINKGAISSNPSSGSVIKIEIGKAKMYIPGNDKTSLSNILKVLMESC